MWKYQLFAQREPRETLKGIILLAVHIRLLLPEKTGRYLILPQTLLHAGGAAQRAVSRIIGAFAIDTAAKIDIIPGGGYHRFLFTHYNHSL